jgi:hypothetical protein
LRRICPATYNSIVGHDFSFLAVLKVKQKE